MKMKLSALLAALSSNVNVVVTLIDDNDNILVSFGAPGYGTISEDLGNRVVKRVKIVTGTQVTVAVEDAETTTPAEETPQEQQPATTEPEQTTTEPSTEEPSNP